MAYTYKNAIKTIYNYLDIDSAKVKNIPGVNERGIEYEFDGLRTVIFIYPISCKQGNKQNFFDTRDSGAKDRVVTWEYAQSNNLRYFCFGVNEEQDRYKDYVLSLESDEKSISNISFRLSETTGATGTQVNIPNDFIPNQIFERVLTPKGFYIAAIRKDYIRDYIRFFDNRPYLDVDYQIELEEDGTEWHEFKLKELPDGFDGSFAHRYINSLIAKPFVILTGNSGTGKTRIAKQISQYLEKDIDGKRNWLIVPVGADWTDNTKMLGFYNPLEKRYVSTPILDFILQACENLSVPHFLILDEMNLSHVERYFSDFLSAMESDEEIPLYKKPIYKEDSGEDEEVIPERIRLPRNLFVTGTVNIDETTYMFSPKVLDRANVVEFKPEKDDVLAIMTGASEVRNIAPADFGIAEGFTRLATVIRNGVCDVDQNKLEQVKDFLDSIYEILQESGFEFAYRTVKEIRQYFAAAYELQKEDFNLTRTMDEQIVQKILPKIYGDRRQIGELLNTIEEKCQKGIGESSEEMSLSIEKIGQMKKRLDKYQYASFM